MASRSPTALALAVLVPALVLGGCHGLRGARWQNRDDGSTGSQLLKGAEHHWGGMTGEMPGGGEIQPPGLRPKGRARRLSKKCTSPPCAGGVGWGQGGKDPSPKACTEPPCNGGTPPTPKASCGTPPCGDNNGEGVAWGPGGNPEGSGESGEESKEIVDEEIDAILRLADADVRDVGVEAVNPLDAFDESEESPSESDSDESPSETSSEESESEESESESESSSEESESSAESSEESLPSEGSAEGDELVVGIDEEPTPTEDPFDAVLRTREHAADDGDGWVEGTLR